MGRPIGFASCRRQASPRRDLRRRGRSRVSLDRTAQAYRKLFGPLLETRDLVLVDQRGQGISEHADCPDLQRGFGPDALALANCAERLGKQFISYRTAAAADDIDWVREALGYEEIALYGDSYGTFLGQSYAYRHGDKLEALVLDSAYPTFGESAWYPSLPKTGVRMIQVACDRSSHCEGDARARLRAAPSSCAATTARRSS